MLKFALTVDCERFISFKQGNPRWNKFEKFKGLINNWIKNLRYNSKGFELIKETVEKEKFPCTMMLVGDLFEKPEKNKYIEWGYHTLNHAPLTLIDDKKVEKEVENKWKLKSITAPMWMIEDIKNPLRVFKILKKEGYTHTVYRGKNNRINHSHYNTITKPVKKEGITCVHVSGFLEGNFSKEKIARIKEDILENINQEGIFLLTTHDFTHKNNKNLLEIMSFVKRLETKKKIKIRKLGDIK
jgi:hypothetical protein